jgi:MFS superfamily sulfate permease-like transporter
MKSKYIQSFLKQDFPAGLVVFFVALPLCLGIASASTGDANKVFSGILSGIIGGIIVGSLSKSAIGVSGPAAGLIIIVATAIENLGFEAFLLSVFIAGFFQILMGLLKAGILGEYLPSSVIKGMLAAIGLILLLKEIPHAMGNDADFMGSIFFYQHDGKNTLSELFHSLEQSHYGAILLSSLTIFILIIWKKIGKKKSALTSLVPDALVAVVISSIANQVFIHFIPDLALDERLMVSVPSIQSWSEFKSELSFPAFHLWHQSAIYTTAVTIAIVASMETLLSVEAADKLDPIKRKTPTNRELIAQGIGNMTAGLIGALPITQVIVRSSANVNAGGRTKTSTILHGFLLLLIVLLFPSLLNTIPRAALSGILIIIGWKLCSFKLFKEMYYSGKERYIPFGVTIIAILFTNLLEGILIGMAVAIYFILHRNYKNAFKSRTEILPNGKPHLIVTLAEEVTILNKGSILQMLNTATSGSKITLDATHCVNLDSDVVEAILDYKNHTAPYHDIEVVCYGLNSFHNLI